MPPSASKQKRLAEKAAKQVAKGKGATDASTSTSTPTGSVYGSSVNTPLTSMSAATSQEDLSAMANLQIATDRYVFPSVGTLDAHGWLQECVWCALVRPQGTGYQV